MLEKIGHIRNPLSIVAIFAAIVEVSGAAVLPFLSDGNQASYLWFLMLFPAFLVLVFFLTLNFNHTVLYAPSDFKEDSSFLDLLSRSTPAERFAKISQEIDEVQEEKQTTREGTPTPIRKQNEASTRTSIRASYVLAEELAIQKVSAELGMPVDRDVRSHAGPGPGYIFDGVARGGGSFIVVEVKYVRKDIAIQKVVRTSLDRINAFYTSASKRAKSATRFSTVLAIVLDEEYPGTVDDVKGRAIDLGQHYSFPVDVRVYWLNDLEAELGCSNE